MVRLEESRKTLEPRPYDHVRRADFPLLGWLVVHGARPTVHHGAAIELGSRSVVEGCWAGAFEAEEFLGCSALFGSGMVMAEDGCWFCPPSHTLEGLYLLVHDGRCIVANSLALLLRETGLPLDLDHSYTSKIATVVDGIDDYAKIIYQSNDATIYRIVYDDFLITNNSPTIRRKDAGPCFSDFNSYQNHLLNTMAASFTNARSPARERAYEVVSACSSGYDANAAAALAAKLGCRHAVTVKSARGGDNDSGKPIADRLGLHCTEYPRPTPDERLIEFLVSGGGGADFPIVPFAAALAGTVHVSGCFGDKMWDDVYSDDRLIKRRGRSGDSLLDFRLRIGFFHVPVPAIGLRHLPEVKAISRSPEMDPWRIASGYDRPIPRRILETAGVPRASFGYRKNAVATILLFDRDPLPPALQARFDGFLRHHGRYWSTRIMSRLFDLGHFCYRASYWLSRRSSRGRWLSDWLGFYFKTHEHSPYANMLFIWAMREYLEKVPTSPVAEPAECLPADKAAVAPRVAV